MATLDDEAATVEQNADRRQHPNEMRREMLSHKKVLTVKTLDILFDSTLLSDVPVWQEGHARHPADALDFPD